MNKRTLAAMAVLGLSSALAGETYYTVKANDANTRNVLFTDYTYWAKADGTPAADDSIFNTENDFVICLKERITSTSSFIGKSLTIGKGATGSGSGTITHDSGNFVLSSENVPGGWIFAAGTWTINVSTSGHTSLATLLQCTISGDVAVTAPAKSPFKLAAGQYSYRRDAFTGAVSGGVGTGLKLTPYTKDNVTCPCESFGFRDLSAYSGTIEVAAGGKCPTNGLWSIGVDFGSTACPGTVKLDGAGAAIRFIDKTNQVSVANLEMGDLSRIFVESDGKTSGCLTVTDTYTQNGTVILQFDRSAPFAGGLVPILKVPYASSVSESDFVVSNICADAQLKLLADRFPDEGFADPAVAIVEDETAGTKTVCLQMKPFVALTYKGTSTDWTGTGKPKNASSITNALHWSDGTTDHTNKVVFTNGNRLRMLSYEFPESVFPGEQLVMNGAEGHLHLCNPSNYIDYLYLTAPACSFYASNGIRPPELFGKRLFLSDETLLHLYNYTSCNIVLHPEIVGGGSIMTHGRGSTGSGTFYVEMKGVNTNWTGSLWLHADFDSQMQDSIAKRHPAYGQGCPLLYLADGRSLGGKMPTFTYDALRLSDYAMLQPRADITLEAGLNRGVFVDGAAVYSSSYDLTINQTLTVGGTIYKTGTSTLTLGGPAQFVNYTAGNANMALMWNLARTAIITNYYDSFAVSDMPDADPSRSFLAVSNGYLKVAHVDAVNGLKVDFTPASKAKPGLKLDFNPADADLRLYGVRNVKTDTPFVGTVNVTFDAVNAPAENVDCFTNGVFTVKTEKYAATRNQFNVTFPTLPGYHRTEVSFTSGESGEYTTFGYEYERTGLMILIH